MYMQRSAGHLDRIHDLLKWMLEQVCLGNCLPEVEENGDVVSLTMGRGAAPPSASAEESLNRAKQAVIRLGITGVLARYREEGIEPEYDQISRETNLLASQSNQTQIHYAFEMVKVLERIGDLALTLSAPPIRGKVPEELPWYLGEATRCYLYGFHRGCLVLCRVCLEEALSTKVKSTKAGEECLRDYRQAHPKEGDLACFRNVAKTLGYLEDECWVNLAREISKEGDRVAHRRSVKEENSRKSLEQLRGLLEHLFSE